MTTRTARRGASPTSSPTAALADRLGWAIGPEATHVIDENDTSAYRRKKIRLPNGRVELRTVRPKFRRALDMLASGQADGLLALDLDRTCRDPRDLEDLIDVVESRTPRIPVESVTGSLRLSNDGEVTMARVLVSVANKSSRDTARRVARARLRKAMNGEYQGGKRPFGFEDDGVTIRLSEAAEIVKAADAILAGVSLRAVTADLNRRGVPTVTGSRWATPTVRQLLCAPRAAGLMVYRRELVDVAAPWPAILQREQWEAVRRILKDPNRRTQFGSEPRWLGSLLYRCGHPGHRYADPPVKLRAGSVGARYGQRPCYRCRDSAHLVRAAAPLDAYVEQVLIARLSRRDAVELLAPDADVDTVAVSREAHALRARITEAKDAWESGVFTLAEMKVRTARLSERLAALEERMAAASGRDPLAGLAGNADAAAVWAGLDLGRKRGVLDALVVVTVLPSRKPGPGFDPETVEIVWKQG